jgi:hypothetical protein
MKRVLLAALFAQIWSQTQAQVIADTVSTGAAYTNQVWYSLESDEHGTAPKDNWDIAFDATGFGSTIHINSTIGTMLWKYPNDDTGGWNSVDTTGMDAWTTRWNSETSWDMGAMGRYADVSNPNDLDWGKYNMTTHIVTGDSLYIIKLADGEYKKLWVQSLSGSVYSFKYANLNGTDLQTVSFNKTGYTGQNFGYYSMVTNSELSREPATAAWDLVFTQYTAFIPSAYTVTGVLANRGVEVAKCTDLPDKLTFTDWASASFSADINGIGYNWKSFNGMGYTIKDSTVYFVKTVEGHIWKMIFTGFGGSANGNYIFTKEKLYTETGIATGATMPSLSVALYPNPASGQDVTMVYSALGSVLIRVTDISGKCVHVSEVPAQRGLQQYRLPVQGLQSGVYIVSVISEGVSTQQQLIVR